MGKLRVLGDGNEERKVFRGENEDKMNFKGKNGDIYANK